MTLKQNLLTRVGIILTIYVLMSLPMWWRVPEWRFDLLIWFKFWHSMAIDWRTVWHDIANLERYVTQDTIYTSVIGTIIIILTILYRDDPLRFAYGKAALARRYQFKKMGLNYKAGLVLGKFKRKLLFMNEPLSVLLLAPPGTGKTTGIVVPSVLKSSHSLVIHDPKGEIYDLTHHYKAKHSKVLIFDPTSETCAKFNVFSKDMLPSTNDSISNYIRNVSKILIRTTGDSNNDFFVQEAQNAFTFFASWLIWKHGETSLPTIRNLMLSQTKMQDVIYGMCPSLKKKKDNHVPDEEDWGDEPSDGTPLNILQLARGILSNTGSSKQWAAVVTLLRQSLDVFQSTTVANATDQNCDFTARSLRESAHTIYLKVKEVDKERLSPLMAVVFTSLTQNLLSSMPKQNEMQVSFILDEFVRLGRLDSVIDMPAVGRGYKFNAMFIAQDYGQISHLYSRDKLSAIESNTAYKIILAQNNYQTAKSISDLIGQTTRNRKSETVSYNTKQPMNKSKSYSTSKEGALLITPQDIMNLSHGKGLLLVQSHFMSPITITLPFYFNEPQLKELNNA